MRYVKKPLGCKRLRVCRTIILSPSTRLDGGRGANHICTLFSKSHSLVPRQQRQTERERETESETENERQKTFGLTSHSSWTLFGTYLLECYNLKMEPANLSQTLVIVDQSSRLYSREDLILHRYCGENFKSLTPLLLGQLFSPVLRFPFVSVTSPVLYSSFICH